MVLDIYLPDNFLRASFLIKNQLGLKDNSTMSPSSRLGKWRHVRNFLFLMITVRFLSEVMILSQYKTFKK